MNSDQNEGTLPFQPAEAATDVRRNEAAKAVRRNRKQRMELTPDPEHESRVSRASVDPMEDIKQLLGRMREEGFELPKCTLKRNIGRKLVAGGRKVPNETSSLFILLDGVRIGSVGRFRNAPICLVRRAEAVEIALIHERVGPQDNGELRNVAAPPDHREIRRVLQEEVLQADDEIDDDDD